MPAEDAGGEGGEVSSLFDPAWEERTDESQSSEAARADARDDELTLRE